MSSVENIMKLADRDLAAGRYADAEREYGDALEQDADLYEALHGRGVARTWQSTLWDGDPTALIASTQDAFALARNAGADMDAFADKVAVDVITLTSTKYNDLTHIWYSIDRGENTRAPSPLFFGTWDLAHPKGLTKEDVYLPLLNHLAAIIQVSEFLDSVLEGKESLAVRRLHNVGNLATFYDWLLSFRDTGKIDPDYIRETEHKKAALEDVRAGLEKTLEAPQFQSVPNEKPEGRPLPGVSASVDKDKHLAHFGIRPPFEVICPVCGTIQRSNRSVCFRCGCTFVYDDEIK